MNNDIEKPPYFDNLENCVENLWEYSKENIKNVKHYQAGDSGKTEEQQDQKMISVLISILADCYYRQYRIIRAGDYVTFMFDTEHQFKFWTNLDKTFSFSDFTSFPGKMVMSVRRTISEYRSSYVNYRDQDESCTLEQFVMQLVNFISIDEELKPIIKPSSAILDSHMDNNGQNSITKTQKVQDSHNSMYNRLSILPEKHYQLGEFVRDVLQKLDEINCLNKLFDTDICVEADDIHSNIEIKINRRPVTLHWFIWRFNKRLTKPYNELKDRSGGWRASPKLCIPYDNSYYYFTTQWIYNYQDNNENPNQCYITNFRDVINSIYENEYELDINARLKPNGRYELTLASMYQISGMPLPKLPKGEDVEFVMEGSDEQEKHDSGNFIDHSQKNLMEKLAWFFDRQYADNNGIILNADSFNPFIHPDYTYQRLPANRIANAEAYYDTYLKHYLSRNKQYIHDQIAHSIDRIKHGDRVENRKSWIEINNRFRDYCFQEIRSRYNGFYSENERKIEFFGFSQLSKADYVIDREFIDGLFDTMFSSFQQWGNKGIFCATKLKDRLVFVLNDETGKFNFDKFFSRTQARHLYKSFPYGNIIIRGGGLEWNSNDPDNVVKGEVTGYQIIVIFDLPRMEG